MVGTSRRRLLAQATTLLAGIGLGPHVSAQTTLPAPSASSWASPPAAATT